jgi:hypothetical protein
MAKGKLPNTNEKRMKMLMDELGHHRTALLTERLVKISEITRQDILNDHEKYDSPLWSAEMYLDVCNAIDKYFLPSPEELGDTSHKETPL